MEAEELKPQILAAIDDLNQYLLGNVTGLGLINTLQDTINDVEVYATTIRENKAMKNLNEGKNKKGKMTYEAALREIDAQSAIVAMEAKIEKLKEMAEAKEARLNMVSEDENLSELIDKRAMNEMKKEIKQIKKMQEKLERLYEKKNGKKPEVIDEDEEMNEGGYGMPSYEEDDDKPSMEEEKELDEAHCNTEEDDTDSMKEEEVNEEFLRMQKLAGVISEEEYKTQVDELFGFGKKKRARSGGSDSKGFSMFAYGKDGGKRNIGSGKTAQEARRDGDFQNPNNSST